MKKSHLLIVVLLLFSFLTLQAQKSISAFQFGFKVSPTIGWLKPDQDNYSYDGLAIGFNWGVTGEYNFAANYALTSGITIAMNGGKLKYPHKVDYTSPALTEMGTNHRKYNFKALEIPLILKMKTREIGYMKFFGQIGFGTSFNISAKGKDQFDVDSPTTKTESSSPDLKSDTRLIRESLIIGFGIEYNLSGTTSAIIGFNFDNGFTNILKGKNTINPSLNEKAISNYLELNLGILF